MVMGEPVLSTTMVRGLAAATCSTSASCFPGKSISGRSKPSLCHSPPKPTQTMATSEAAASLPPARWHRQEAVAGTPGGPQPAESPDLANSSVRRYSCPASRGTIACTSVCPSQSILPQASAASSYRSPRAHR